MLELGRKRPSALLRPDACLPDLLGREGELTRLEQWCLRDGDFDARIMTGAAGQGKTRLAGELSRTLQLQGWHTRVVAPTEPGIDAILQLPSKPTLLVIDYAETRSEQVFHLLEGLLQHGLQEKLRLLLIARTASDWWRALVARDAEIGNLLAEVTLQPIEPLTASRERVEELYVTAYRQFSAELQRVVGRVVSAPYKPYSSVLEILQDALSAVLVGDNGIHSGTDLLLAHERRYVTASARSDGIGDVDDVDLNRMAAALTLYGAANEDEAAGIVGECNGELGPAVRRRLARLFRRLYPGNRTYVDGLRPDALAEDLIAAVLHDDGRLPGAAAGFNALDRTPLQRRHALTTLARGAHRHVGLATELAMVVQTGDHELLKVAIEVACQVEDPEDLSVSISQAVESRPAADITSLLEAIPDETVALATLAAQLARRAIADLPEPSELTNRDVETSMACSNRFSDAGWSAEAAASAQLAVDRLLMLDADSRDERTLGRALSNLSNRLWEMGRIGDSLAPAEHAVEVLLRASAPEVELAAARNNFAFRLAEVGQSDQAAVQAAEAHLLCTRAKALEDANVAKTLGSALNNLTCISLASGDHPLALEYGLASVKLRRTQALQSRDRYLPYVARALANAAPAAEACADSDLADRLVIEARSLHGLTGQRAPIFRFEQAESAALHSIMMLHRGDWDGALQIAKDATELLRSIETDLGELTSRLGTTLAEVRHLASEHTSINIRDVATRRSADLKLPQLLEYRDL